jgi:hypothetical protein
MTQKHTQEPWYQHETEGKLYASIRGRSGRCVADCGSRSDAIAQANAKRIVSCVNACAGINPAAVPKLLAALDEFVIEYVEGTDPILDDTLIKARAAIKEASKV